MGILLTLSFLSKGPVGFYSLFILLLAHYVIFPKEIFTKKTLSVIFSLIISIAIASIWGISMYFNHGNYFLDVLKNEVSAWSTKHSHSFIFYTDFVVYMGSWMFFLSMFYLKFPRKKKVKFFIFGLY